MKLKGEILRETWEPEKANERREGKGEGEAGTEDLATGGPLGWGSNTKGILSVPSGEQDLRLLLWAGEREGVSILAFHNSENCLKKLVLLDNHRV